jgi:hypothetical protein
MATEMLAFRGSSISQNFLLCRVVVGGLKIFDRAQSNKIHILKSHMRWNKFVYLKHEVQSGKTTEVLRNGVEFE